MAGARPSAVTDGQTTGPLDKKPKISTASVISVDSNEGDRRQTESRLFGSSSAERLRKLLPTTTLMSASTVTDLGAIVEEMPMEQDEEEAGDNKRSSVGFSSETTSRPVSEVVKMSEDSAVALDASAKGADVQSAESVKEHSVKPLARPAAVLSRLPAPSANSIKAHKVRLLELIFFTN